MTLQLPAETFLPADETPLRSSRRQDGWSAANQRLFLEAIAEGHGVDVACGRVGLSAASAYAFRRTAKGAAFALGWRAATLLARDCIAETLLVRALEGQVETITHENGRTITRHRYDNGLATRLLGRLDRQVESAPDADVQAARLVAQEFDAFLGLVERGEGAARAGLFLACRSDRLAGPIHDTARDLTPIYALAAADRLVRTGVATAGEIHIADLDPAARADWTAEQWARAEAAGLLAFAAPAPAEPAPQNAPASQHSQHSADPDTPEPVWWDEQRATWRTNFPPPADFLGWADQDPEDVDYERDLSDAELALMDGSPERHSRAEFAALIAERDAYFASRAADYETPEPGETPPHPLPALPDARIAAREPMPHATG